MKKIVVFWTSNKIEHCSIFENYNEHIIGNKITSEGMKVLKTELLKYSENNNFKIDEIILRN